MPILKITISEILDMGEGHKIHAGISLQYKLPLLRLLCGVELLEFQLLEIAAWGHLKIAV